MHVAVATAIQASAIELAAVNAVDAQKIMQNAAEMVQDSLENECVSNKNDRIIAVWR